MHHYVFNFTIRNEMAYDYELIIKILTMNILQIYARIGTLTGKILSLLCHPVN